MRRCAMRPKKPLSSKVLFDERGVKVRVDKLKDHTGKAYEEVVEEKPHVAIIVAVRRGGNEILVISNYRHQAGSELMEFPGGKIEENEKPEDAARRELYEETGCEAESLIALGAYWYTGTSYQHVFVAQNPEHRDIHRIGSADDTHRPRWISRQHWEEVVMKSSQTTVGSVAAWCKYRIWSRS